MKNNKCWAYNYVYAPFGRSTATDETAIDKTATDKNVTDVIATDVRNYNQLTCQIRQN